MDTKEFDQWWALGKKEEKCLRLLFAFLYMDLFRFDQNTSDESTKILNEQINEATGVKLGNYLQSIEDSLTLVPNEWHWEPLWQELLRRHCHGNRAGSDRRIG